MGAADGTWAAAVAAICAVICFGLGVACCGTFVAIAVGFVSGVLTCGGCETSAIDSTIWSNLLSIFLCISESPSACSSFTTLMRLRFSLSFNSSCSLVAVWMCFCRSSPKNASGLNFSHSSGSRPFVN